MAAKDYIAVTYQTSLKRTVTACNQIATEMGINPPEVPMQNRDKDYLHAKQLEAVAAWLEDLAKVAAPKKKAKASV